MDLFGPRRAETLGCGWRVRDSRLGGIKLSPYRFVVAKRTVGRAPIYRARNASRSDAGGSAPHASATPHLPKLAS